MGYYNKPLSQKLGLYRKKAFKAKEQNKCHNNKTVKLK